MLLPPAFLYRSLQPHDDPSCDQPMVLGDWRSALSMGESWMRSLPGERVKDRIRLQRLKVVAQRPLLLERWPQDLDGWLDVLKSLGVGEPLFDRRGRTGDGPDLAMPLPVRDVLRAMGHDLVGGAHPAFSGRFWQSLLPSAVVSEGLWPWSDVLWRSRQIEQAVIEGDLVELGVAFAGGGSVEAWSTWTDQDQHVTIAPLITAVEHRNHAVVQRLLTLGADPNQPSPQGDTPLLVAAQRNAMAAVQTLLDFGGNVAYRHPVSGRDAIEEARAHQASGALILALERQALTDVVRALPPSEARRAPRRRL